MKECPICRRCLEDDDPVCPDDASEPREAFAGPPTLDGRYRLIARLGDGGHGRVYKARHLGLQRLVAVKLLHPEHRADAGFVVRFRREAEALGRLTHPNIVEVSDSGIEPVRRIPYLVMEYLRGITLEERLRNRGPLTPEEALPIFEGIAGGLDYAHSQGILHRDLKPSNIFLSDGGAFPPGVKIVDFGLAGFHADPERTLSGRPAATAEDVSGPETETASQTAGTGPLLGSPGYIAPEILRRRPASPAADRYAFGVLIYATLLGRPPFRGRAADVLDATLHRDPPAPSASGIGLAACLDEPVLSALAKEPGARPGSASELVARLRRAVEPAPARPPPGQRIRHPVLALLTGLVAVLLASLLEAPSQGLEDRLVDVRFQHAPARSPHHPLTLLLIDNPSLTADPAPLADPARADEMGELLGRVLESGAAGVGIDLLLPESWSASLRFSAWVAGHADAVVLAAFSGTAAVIGPETLHPLAVGHLGPEGARDVFGFVNLELDRDGQVRRARADFRDVDGAVREAFATRAARIASPSGELRNLPSGSFLIDFTLDERRLDRLSWRDLRATLEHEPGRFRGRFLVVGSSYAGSGDGPYRAPRPRELPEELSGPELQALIIHTLLDGAAIRPVSGVWTSAALAALAALSAALILLLRSPGARLAVVLLGSAAWIASAQALFVQERLVLPVVPCLLAWYGSLGLALILRKGSS